MADWRVKFDGTCSRCGSPLPRGTVAIWERATRTIRCVECLAPPLPPPPPPVPAPVDAGIAGASARREHDRRAAKREARIEATYGHGFVGRVVRAVSIEPQSTRAWAVGAAGEEKLARELSKLPGIRILNDRRVPGTPANIDHIVIAPAGVFVVDAKHVTGRIDIRDRGGLFRTDKRLYVGGRDRSKLARAMSWQVDSVVKALEGAGIEPLPPVVPVLCFIDGDFPLLFPPKAFEGVKLASQGSIIELLMSSIVVSSTGIDSPHGRARPSAIAQGSVR